MKILKIVTFALAVVLSLAACKTTSTGVDDMFQHQISERS